jgi:hypothetical protein
MNNKTELIFNKWTKCLENITKQTKVVEEKQNIMANATANYNNENMVLNNLKSEYSKEGN